MNWWKQVSAVRLSFCSFLSRGQRDCWAQHISSHIFIFKKKRRGGRESETEGGRNGAQTAFGLKETQEWEQPTTTLKICWKDFQEVGPPLSLSGESECLQGLQSQTARGDGSVRWLIVLSVSVMRGCEWVHRVTSLDVVSSSTSADDCQGACKRVMLLQFTSLSWHLCFLVFSDKGGKKVCSRAVHQ